MQSIVNAYWRVVEYVEKYPQTTLVIGALTVIAASVWL